MSAIGKICRCTLPLVVKDALELHLDRAELSEDTYSYDQVAAYNFWTP